MRIDKSCQSYKDIMLIKARLEREPVFCTSDQMAVKCGVHPYVIVGRLRYIRKHYKNGNIDWTISYANRVGRGGCWWFVTTNPGKEQECIKGVERASQATGVTVSHLNGVVRGARINANEDDYRTLTDEALLLEVAERMFNQMPGA